MTTPIEENDWRKEFELKFCRRRIGNSPDELPLFNSVIVAIDVEDFFHQELQKARAEGFNEGMKAVRCATYQEWLREEILKLESEKEQDECLGEERKNCPWCGRNMYCRGRVEEIAWNQALQTIIDRYQSELDQTNK